MSGIMQWRFDTGHHANWLLLLVTQWRCRVLLEGSSLRLAAAAHLQRGQGIMQALALAFART